MLQLSLAFSVVRRLAADWVLRAKLKGAVTEIGVLCLFCCAFPTLSFSISENRKSKIEKIFWSENTQVGEYVRWCTGTVPRRKVA